MASGVSLAVSGAEQPLARSAGCHLARADTSHGRSGQKYDGISPRYPGNGRAWDRRSARPWGLYKSGCCTESDTQQGSLRGSADVASNHSARRREIGHGENTAFTLHAVAGEAPGNSLREIQPGGFF